MEAAKERRIDDYRIELLSSVKRAVLKVGSGVLTGRTGLNLSVINDLSSSIYEIMARGIQIVLVSSGAIASGFKKLGMVSKPKTISEKQAVAATGQPALIMAWKRPLSVTAKRWLRSLSPEMI